MVQMRDCLWVLYSFSFTTSGACCWKDNGIHESESRLHRRAMGGQNCYLFRCEELMGVLWLGEKGMGETRDEGWDGMGCNYCSLRWDVQNSFNSMAS